MDSNAKSTGPASMTRRDTWHARQRESSAVPAAGPPPLRMKHVIASLHHIRPSRRAMVALLLAAVFASLLSGWVMGAALSPGEFIQMRKALDVQSDLHWSPFEVNASIGVSMSGIKADYLRYSHFTSMSNAPDRRHDLIAEVQFGLPFRSHSYVAISRLDDSVYILPSSRYAVGSLSIPARLDFAGMAGNSLCVLVLLGCACSLAPLRRASMRIRQGHCVKCGYDRIGLTQCPECGDRT